MLKGYKLCGCEQYWVRISEYRGCTHNNQMNSNEATMANELRVFALDDVRLAVETTDSPNFVTGTVAPDIGEFDAYLKHQRATECKRCGSTTDGDKRIDIEDIKDQINILTRQANELERLVFKLMKIVAQFEIDHADVADSENEPEETIALEELKVDPLLGGRRYIPDD